MSAPTSALTSAFPLAGNAIRGVSCGTMNASGPGPVALTTGLIRGLDQHATDESECQP